MSYQTTFIGLRERGSEGIACPKGGLSPLSGYPNIVHRPIGRFVVSGRGVDDNSRLEVDDSSVCSGILFSPCRGALNNPSMCPVCDCFPPLNSCQKQKRLSPVGSSPLSPSAVRSLGAIKKKNHASMEQLCGFFKTARFRVAGMSLMYRCSLIRREDRMLILFTQM